MTSEPPIRIDWERARELLSPRERQVLRLWEQGVGIRRTCVLLGIGESTVRTHRARIVQKIGNDLDAVGEAC